MSRASICVALMKCVLTTLPVFKTGFKVELQRYRKIFLTSECVQNQKRHSKARMERFIFKFLNWESGIGGEIYKNQWFLRHMQNCLDFPYLC